MEKLAQLGFILARRGRVGLAWTPDGAGEELVRVCAGGVTAAGGAFPRSEQPGGGELGGPAVGPARFFVF